MPKSYVTPLNDGVYQDFKILYHQIDKILMNLLDTPVIKTYHVGSTAIKGSQSSHILDVLVVVKSLHQMTTLDEKRLNLQSFYRLHHPYEKKCVFSKFDDLKTLNEKVRLHIVEENSTKFKKYINAQRVLEHHADLCEQFNTFKSKIDSTVSKQIYETNKSEWLQCHVNSQKA
ncbi:GrpB family protein [Macrococcus sp. DPC7161]|uniref:GrpB family protein n=1 Tax=Macrococcus sp. DPC7161 TaxID=2507060 RepID=UPI0013E98829|nr:GrpB family protein [Macrococcus sp. DPC7161]